MLTAASWIVPTAAPTQSIAPVTVAARNKAMIIGAYDRWAKGGRTFYDGVLAPDMDWTALADDVA